MINYAVYETKNITNREHINLMYNISNIPIKRIIESIPNRCVIFPGHLYHGGYIKDHNTYYYNWRINLVNFYEVHP
jgi:hypothetical protein